MSPINEPKRPNDEQIPRLLLQESLKNNATQMKRLRKIRKNVAILFWLEIAFVIVLFGLCSNFVLVDEISNLILRT